MNPILAQYIPIADMIVKTFGEEVEVVLHDLSHPQNSVIYVANNKVTGRRVGESFHYLFSKALRAKEQDHGILANYYFEQDGKKIRSSSVFIRNEAGELVGALCINIDTSKVCEQIKWLRSYLPGLEQAPLNIEPKTPDAPLSEDIMQMVNTLIDRIVDASPAPRSRDERLELIRFMDSRGVFLVKGAMDRAAAKLNMSKVTLYSDLDEVRRKSSSEQRG